MQGEVYITMDFFEVTGPNVASLNQTERQLFEYVVKNMDEVKNMSIQKFAEEKFLSTTTIFRFTQKLGFSGYSNFINSLMVTSHTKQAAKLPGVLLKQDYSEDYLVNAIETIRVMPTQDINKVVDVLRKNPSVYILTDDNAHHISQYSEKIFMGLGLHTYAPEATYQMQSLETHISDDDVLIILSYSGEDKEVVDFVQKVFLRARPFLMSVTSSGNNTIENLSDVNFYIFAEEIQVNNMNLTSCIPMLMVLELLGYTYLARESNEKSKSQSEASDSK